MAVRRGVGAIAVAVGVVLAVGACSGDGGDGDDVATTTTTEASGSESTASTTSTTPDPRAGESVATLTVPIDVERPDDLATFDVQSLTVEGETMVLRFSITPDFASEDDATAISLYDVYRAQAAGAFIRLIDRVNLKEYSVIYDAPNHWMSDSTEVEAVNGEPMYVYAVFAAPEDDIDVVDLTFRDTWPTLVDVPIER